MPFRLIIVLASLLLATGVWADTRCSQPQILVVTAHSELTLTAAPAVTTCQGIDGTYTLTHLTAAGPTVSSDPRLVGTFNADALLFHNPLGIGISEDNFTITDPVTGKVKVRGVAYAMDDGGAPIKGQVISTLADGSRFWAMSTITLPPPGANGPLLIDYGLPGAGVSDRANIIVGKCGDSEQMFQQHEGQNQQ